ncbi:hypothetical protein DPMN_007861 [Dreissena polymorpha]|uniref:Sushi domain-containing protein n=1 Tax=Dreissena polymorpha TaxID=45954 RepID=A0A9D4MUB7_DREPO|nr:hypothetical protein DPMN_007861 [Dreissena polymorpha]
MTYQGTNIGHTSTYTCLSGYEHTCGDLYRSCNGSGAWSGSTPVCRIADVRIATSQNDVRFMNIEENQTISIDIQLADMKSIAYIRLYINDTTENQATIIVQSSFQ